MKFYILFYMLFFIPSVHAFEPEQVFRIGSDYPSFRLEPECIFYEPEDNSIYVGGKGRGSSKNISFFYKMDVCQGHVPRLNFYHRNKTLIETQRSTCTQQIYKDKSDNIVTINGYARKWKNKDGKVVTGGLLPYVVKHKQFKKISEFVDTSSSDHPYFEHGIALALNKKKEIFSIGSYRDAKHPEENVLSICKYDKEGKFLIEKRLQVEHTDNANKRYRPKKLAMDSYGSFYALFEEFYLDNDKKQNLIIKIAHQLSTVWTTKLDFKSDAYTKHVIANQMIVLDGRIMVCGYHKNMGSEVKMACILRYNIRNGKLDWRTTWNLLDNAELDGMLLTKDLGILATGHRQLGDDNEYIFVKFNISKQLEYIYNRKVSTSLGLSAKNIIEIRKGFYLAIGSDNDALNILFNDKGVGVEDKTKNNISLNAYYNSGIHLNFSTKEVLNVKLIVSDYLGNQVASHIIKNQTSGDHSHIFNQNFPNGAYLVSMEVGGQILTKRVMVVK